MRSVFKALALSAMTLGLLGGQEARSEGWSAGSGCAQCQGGAGHGRHRGLQPGCTGDDLWCPVYPAFVYYPSMRKLAWGPSVFPYARRYQPTEIQIFPPLPYSTPRAVPAPTTTPPAPDALAPVM
jgi:hypothetical protein